MIKTAIIMVIVLCGMLCVSLIYGGIATIYKHIKRHRQDIVYKEESIRNTIDELRRRLDYHSETVGQMNWKLSEMEEKLNEKKSNRTKRNK